ncbi:MAG TPA: UDP-glucose--hexose-1-phosphate uridylyltransferase [Cyclobacteriaceae bacterium]
MSVFDFNEHAHRRLNPLTGEWVQVSPHRAKRPWQGQVEKTSAEQNPAYDPTCYLCPGNVRSNGELNPQYTSTYAFTNDFSAVVEDVPSGEIVIEGLLTAKSERGICRVICFSPRHDLTIPEMEVTDIRNVVDLWVNEYETLGALDFIQHVQIFENKGAVMGCSNPHPHGQIWAQESIPVEPFKKQANQLACFKQKGHTLLADYIQIEQRQQQRIVFENDHFITIVPFWATWPFETMIIPKRPMARITEMTADERNSFAEAYKRIAVRYDNLFEISFPYSAGIHQAPTDGAEHPEWHWHMSFYPPLLRSATVKKFMVGYEMLANPQRDVTPEFSAAKLRSLSEIHFKQKV